MIKTVVYYWGLKAGMIGCVLVCTIVYYCVLLYTTVYYSYCVLQYTSAVCSLQRPMLYTYSCHSCIEICKSGGGRAGAQPPVTSREWLRMQLWAFQSEYVCCCALLCTTVNYSVLITVVGCVLLFTVVYYWVLLCTPMYYCVLLVLCTVCYNIRLWSAGLQSAAANDVYVFLVTPVLRFANPGMGGLELSPRSQAGND